MGNTNFKNTFTGESVNTYVPAAFAALSTKKKPRRKKDEIVKKLQKKCVCKYCKQPMQWVRDTNIMVCKNEKCPGLKIKNTDGEVIATLPSFHRISNLEQKVMEEKE